MSEALTRLLRWEESGGNWRVLVRTPDAVELALLTCDAGEEVDRLLTADPAVLDHLGDRDRSGQ
ncbi:hypothetical protein ACFQFC_38820 [Amorphoplanes digitatis]|uniref:Uncharacterized protein n=1 Tax=Actinoplanes digitatis TaxID=1868 RepID=A0A7W7HWM4_9ACTN|nr:hypothetical protein [Actinoplanes digitatis]MBB4762121.1 hypothetical protein [Actinoplanes digitatis]GID96219.1 hypothetical protein Adi01nite_56310 [Actinoplanes digitatis]